MKYEMRNGGTRGYLGLKETRYLLSQKNYRLDLKRKPRMFLLKVVFGL